ncbi:nucleotidyltransferase domain-containing protein, partial [Candidatus Woesearchaeota archaeon]|nr:nucleotidyltransferase domain-containing protein [Candidatus Woesearchaeota archaeon]
MLQKSSIQLTAEVFYCQPTKDHTLKEISNSIKIAHTSVKHNLQKLVKQGIITKTLEKKGKRTFPLYKANRNNILFIRYKKIYNLSELIDSGIISYIEEKLMPKSIVLFGSYQRGEDTEESDVDIFVESNKKELQIQPFEKKIGRKIELHFNNNFT